MVLSEAEETITTVEIDEETYEEVYKTTKRTIPFLFIRGDGKLDNSVHFQQILSKSFYRRHSCLAAYENQLS